MDFIEDEIHRYNYYFSMGICLKKTNHYDFIKYIDLEHCALNSKNYGKNTLNYKSDECSICLENFSNSKKKYYNSDYKSDVFDNNNKSNSYCTQLLNCCNIFTKPVVKDEYEDENNINKVCIISCHHIFHSKCILEWLKKNHSCPICRSKIKIIK